MEHVHRAQEPRAANWSITPTKIKAICNKRIGTVARKVLSLGIGERYGATGIGAKCQSHPLIGGTVLAPDNYRQKPISYLCEPNLYGFRGCKYFIRINGKF